MVDVGPIKEVLSDKTYHMTALGVLGAGALQGLFDAGGLKPPLPDFLSSLGVGPSSANILEIGLIGLAASALFDSKELAVVSTGVLLYFAALQVRKFVSGGQTFQAV